MFINQIYGSSCMIAGIVSIYLYTKMLDFAFHCVLPGKDMLTMLTD